MSSFFISFSHSGATGGKQGAEDARAVGLWGSRGDWEEMTGVQAWGLLSWAGGGGQVHSPVSCLFKGMEQTGCLGVREPWEGFIPVLRAICF